MQATFSTLLDLIQGLAALIVLAAGAGWSYAKWRRRREHAPRIEFNVDVIFVGVHYGHWLVEIVALVDNKGLVQHTIREFAFDLRALMEDDPVEDGAETINYQVRIPHKIKEGAWIPKEWEFTFIEPGLRTRYSYVSAVPANARFLLLHGRFDYDKEAFHTADKLIAVPTHQLGERGQRSNGV